jgi:C4-dicarboxylate-binding protein DctP
VREQFLTIVDEVTQTRNAESAQVNQEAKQAIIDAGGEVRQLTPEQRAAWVEAMNPVWEQFESDVGEENLEAAVSSNSGA